jgi:anthraniloyl-CoA monooxygenase
MKILIVGGGPGGLYLALLLKLRDATHDIKVVERNSRGDTFGWGVVFSDSTLRSLEAHDASSFAEIDSKFARWDDLELRHLGGVLVSGGHKFSAISRHVLLSILQRRCEAVDVKLSFDTEVLESEIASYDLVVGADGVGSRMRKAFESSFGTHLDVHPGKHIWYGTSHPFKRFTFNFHQNEHGVFWTQAYRFDDATSTYNIGCTEEVWRRAGLDRASEHESIEYCQKVCASDLEGQPLLSNRSRWLNFVTVRNQRWSHENLVLLGDAAHTAHFTTGSGTKLAMMDAIALAGALESHPNLGAALQAYEAERKPESARFQHAAADSMRWFTDVHRYYPQQLPQLAANLLTRGRMLSYTELKARDPGFVDHVDRWFAGSTDPHAAPRSPMFTPFTVRGMTLANRVVTPSVHTGAAKDGTPSNWHLVHYGSRAVGGAGLLITEMNAVSADGRITSGCAGLYEPEHRDAWKGIATFVHEHSGGKIGARLSHAGLRGATKTAPDAMSRADLDRVRDAFVRGATMAHESGFDLVELQMAHGYLLSTFLSPLSNARVDTYGGSAGNRARYPLEVFEGMRAAWPKDKPISVRLSAADCVPGGATKAELVELARALKERGCDLVHVSSADPLPLGRQYQMSLSDEIRGETGVATIAVGSITTADEINTILSSGRADLCALGRPILADPYWLLHAGGAEATWPAEYEAARVREGHSDRDRLLSQAPPTLVATILRQQRRIAELEQRARRSGAKRKGQ